MEGDVPQVGPDQLGILTSYLGNLSLFMPVDQEQFRAQLQKEPSQITIKRFASDFAVKYLVVSRVSDNTIEVLDEWSPEVLKRNNVVVMKKGNFTLFKDMPRNKISEMVQVANINFEGEADPIGVSYGYVNKLMIPMLNAYKSEVDKKSKIDQNSFGNLVKKANELNLTLVQCQQNVSVPEVKLEIDDEIKRVVKQNQVQKFVENAEQLDADMIKKLSDAVIKWNRDISVLLKTQFDLLSASTLQEQNFWHNFVSSLRDLEQQLQSKEVAVYVDVLRKKNKFHITTSFDVESLHFKNMLQKASAISSFFREIRIEELMTTQKLSELVVIISTILIQFKNIIKLEYDARRSSQFIEVLSRDLNNQMVKILSNEDMMFMNYVQFKEDYERSQEIFKKFEENASHFITRRRPQTNFTRMMGNDQYNITFQYLVLKARLEKMFKIRELYEKLHTVIEDIIKKEKKSSQKGFLSTGDIEEGYNAFRGLNILDLSKEGDEVITRAEKEFNFKIDKAETFITEKLREKLGGATSANEMFRIFAKFNELFFRPRIVGAIEEYQSQLLKTVKDDIANLNQKFLRPYVQTENAKICKVRDCPQTAGTVIWAKQITERLKKYMDKVGKILPRNWGEHPEGRQLKNRGDALLKRLSTDPILVDWNKEINTYLKTFQIAKVRIFSILPKRNRYEIVVNFDEKLINVIKEIKMLTILQVKLVYAITHHYKTFTEMYPFAVSLQESIHSYNQISAKIDDKVGKLVAQSKKTVMGLITEGFTQSWGEKTVVDKFSKSVAESVLSLHELVSTVSEKTEYINSVVQALNTCPLESEILQEKLKSIQEVIDEFDLKNVSNLHIWVPELNRQLEVVFAKRLEVLVKEWVAEFLSFKTIDEENGHKLLKDPTRHELKTVNNVFYLDPPMEFAKFTWLQEFHRTLGIICSLPKLAATRYINSLATRSSVENFESVLGKMPPNVLKIAYSEVYRVFREAEQYIGIWLNYEALWEIDAKKIYERLGEDINLWQKLLTEIRENRRTFDNSEIEKYFGPIIIDYHLVLYHIKTKYDSWHAEILNHFGNKFADKLRAFYKNLQSARTKLEKINFQNLSADIVEMITDFQDIKRKHLQWSQDIEKFSSGNKLLEKQRYKEPADWLELEKVMTEWSSFKQAFSKKSNQLETQMTRLQTKITSDESALNERIREIENIWNKDKPSSGEMLPQSALSTLQILSSRVVKVKEDYEKCCQAKQLLGLTPGDTQKLEILQEEIELLNEVWRYLHKVWEPYESIKDTLIAAITNTKIKQIEMEATAVLNKIPHKLKTNEPFDKMKAKVGPGGSLLKMNKKISDLKEESMKPRHWKQLLSKLGLKVSQNEVTFNILWTADLNRNENTVRDILSVASGENVLEALLGGVKEHWGKFELELVRYQSKCNLIKGWDDLFTKLDEDMSNLSSMKISQYYKTFEEEIQQWDEKLQKVKLTMDTWIDVQKRWVYLEGIFMGSSDIKEMLSNEYTRFKGIDAEFTSLMKKVSAKPNMIEIMNIPGLHKTLERLSELLANVQKALGDYLETQRSAFARFYFVGDEDLLEIIGNSKDVAIVQRHFTKMYAGITSLKAEKVDGNELVLKMTSREGEIVDFKKPVNITEDSKINVWLTKVDNEMRFCLAANLESSIKEITALEEEAKDNINQELLRIIERYPAQVVLLGLQVLWSFKVETALINGGGEQLKTVENYVLNFLAVLAESVMANLQKDLRQKFEQAITDFVHQRDVVRILIRDNIVSNKVFAWLYFMRMIYYPKEQDILKKLLIQMANANFHYGFEYLGVGEKLVQTPLTDRCFLTLTQALHLRMGGAPFGPAGTGKTESVKALGAQLGRFVLVFNCDETFDFHAMGRIFIGLCQVGAWGCFDEFNRLEERMLSACSQQILVIQTGLRERLSKIQLMNKEVKLNPQMGSFVTMNPGYAGRSNLPENLKQLFRQMAMVKPDRELIAQVMLYSQGYRTAEQLAGKIVSLFELCNDQLSSQPHYDFGLRALKSVLVSAGNMKREEIGIARAKNIDISKYGEKELEEFEQRILLRSVCETVVPKLIADDIPLLSTLLRGVFPGSSIPAILQPTLRGNLAKICGHTFLLPEEKFIEKVLQLFQIQRLHHGLMMVGPSGCGKTKAWQLLLQAMEWSDKIKGEAYVIDPKAINKDELYGRLDSTTLEWTDGVFTGVLRKIAENQRGELNKRHWIIFDGDVDPEWAENLNSVLDDNKLLTLPNGERIQIPPNVRIMFEVETLKYATLATVSRCGMVWFSEEIISYRMLFHHYLCRLRQDDYDTIPKVSDDEDKKKEKAQQQQQQVSNPIRDVRNRCVEVIEYFFEGDNSFASQAIELASSMQHVMEFTKIRVIEATFALIRKGISNVLEYNESHPELSIDDEVLIKYMRKWTLQAFMWGVAGSMTLLRRGDYSKAIAAIIPRDVSLPPQLGAVEGAAGVPYILIDFEVKIEDGEWSLWKKKVPTIEIDPQRVTDADLIITTVDTLRHQEILCSWLSEHRPFILCGPPGSGKTMTLMSTLKSLPEFEMIFVNFSSSTSPALIMKQFDHYCEYVKTVAGIILRPKQPNKWLVVFCDEINLPDTDKYATMTVITFLRQLTEQHGFWRTSDRQWVSLERIQFVGACNPPTDIGRKPLSPRFLRHCPLILVDFPGFDSLKQIFGTFNKAMLKRNLSLRGFADCLTLAMIEFYAQSQQHFTSDIQPHYIYSPRELTRWKYALNEAIDNMDTIEDLVRLWSHEAMRLFQDRLVQEDEKQWCDKLIDEVALRNFPNVNTTCLERPVLFSNFFKKNYVSVERNELRKHVEGRLRSFYEQQLNVPIVVFDEVLEHILRIDRVLRQPLGHCLLVGSSGVGKTTLSRFVSWINGISVFQIKAGRNYSLSDFDEDLRSVMKRAGVKNEKICFIFDESNCLSPAFLEKMNALLASGEIPGLFEGEQYLALINQFKEAAMHNKMMDADDQLYRNFIKNVQRNLHVVFTMNPNNPDFSNRTASSPALFNRCVIDWFGDWSQEGLYQVAKQFTLTIDPIESSFTTPIKEDELRHNVVINTIVNIHNTVGELNHRLSKSAKKFNYITPRDFLDFIKQFTTLYNEKKSLLEDQQLHLNSGLDKLKQTENQVLEMQGSLDIKKLELEKKEREASIKMGLIVTEKTNAKEKAELSTRLKAELDVKQKEIAENKKLVEEELSEAEPALEAAKKSVESINRADLETIRAYARPPDKVELALKPVYYMITKEYNAKEQVKWPAIKALMAKDFISNIVNLKTSDIPLKVKNYILQTYMNTPEWNIDELKRASSASGAIAVWAMSQIKYADILTKVEPLKNKISELEKEGMSMQAKAEEVSATILMLEKKTKQLELEYESLIKEKQNIQTDMERVEDKVSRSKRLLYNLESEKHRWEDSSKNFKEQLATMLGDVFLSSAFLSYIGFFDHYYRKLLVGAWKTTLESSEIRFRNDISLIEYLSSAGERLIWKSHKLPSDDLCTENAIILKRFNRYPLIIDPSGQALQFITSMLSSKKYNLSSFVDDSFMKNLETSLRFGFPLIVQDVEKVDPILNSVLNKEIYKTGGRVLIRVGDQQIDFSSNFSMYMITRDSNARFTPDLCSRVTFVNFTITPSSLEDQCLNILLKNERPDTEEKRLNLMKLQGEYIVKLRELEDSLLDALNHVQGSILESESVITTLEKLKTEASKVTEEMKQSNDVLAEVETVTNSYKPLAQAASKIFFALLGMSNLHYLYEYSLQFFMDTIFSLLENEERLNSISKKEFDKRKAMINHLLFERVFLRVCNSLLTKDVNIFALKLAEIKLEKETTELFSYLYKPTIILKTSLSNNILDGHLTDNQLKQVEELMHCKVFEELLLDMEKNSTQWKQFLESANPEQHIPVVGGKVSQSERALINCIIMKIFRPDKFNIVTHGLLRIVLGDKCIDDQTLDLKKVIASCKAKESILLSSAPGFDPSFKVESTSKELNNKLLAVAIGSSEGFDLAERAIKEGVKQGHWVMLKNVHLAPTWLSELEKKIHGLNPHPNFRLFLTAEFSPKIPSTLIRQSFKLVFEPPDGIKASLLRTYKTVLSPSRSDKLPMERSRLHFLLGWLHAVIIERLRYTPIGWTKVYEFNEADQRCALDLIDEYIDNMGSRNNVDIDKIPWDAFKTILIQNLYGGKIDNEYDSKVLVSLVEKFFTPLSFDSNTPLYNMEGTEGEVEALKMPEGIKYSQYLTWIEKLPDSESPAWSGLPVNVEKILKSQQTERMMSMLFKLQDVNEEQVTLSKKKKQEGSEQVAWLKEVYEKVKSYFTILPSNLAKMERTEGSLNDPLFRFLEREVTVASKLLSVILKNNSQVKDLCEGKLLATNILKALAKDIHSDSIPKGWVTFTVHPTLQLSPYVLDLKKRLQQFSRLMITPNYQRSGVWFGGLLYPEAYMTATRQAVAQRFSWSLEELEPCVTIYRNEDMKDDCFLLTGMSIEGATWDKDTNVLAPLPQKSEISSVLPTLLFRWVKVEKRNVVKEDEMLIPVYLNVSRKNIILSIKLKCGDNRTALYQKGVAIVAWS